MGRSGVDESELRRKLDSWSRSEHGDTMKQVVSAGPVGARLLVEQLRRRADSESAAFISALGDADLSHGNNELLEIAGSDTAGTDVRCAALVAITKRIGSEATLLLEENLESPNRNVQQYAMRCLAYAGNGTAWEVALSRWVKWLVRPTKRVDIDVPDETVGLAYLLIHIAGKEGREQELSHALRTLVPRMATTTIQALELVWPNVAPAAKHKPLVVPNATQTLTWIRDRLEPLFARGMYH
jgi:hypothetical protein